MFGLIKNNIKTKIGIVLPASYPASRVIMANGDSVEDVIDGVSSKPAITYQQNGHIANINIYNVPSATNVEVTGLPTPYNDNYALIVLWSGSSMVGSLQYVLSGGSYKWILNNSGSYGGYGGGTIVV